VPNWLAPKADEQPSGSQGDEQTGQNQQPSEPLGATPPPDQSEVPGVSEPGANPDPADNTCFAPQVYNPKTKLCDTPTDPWYQRWWKAELTVVLLLLLLTVPMLIRIGMRRRHWHLAGAAAEAGTAAEWAWVELRDSAIDLGYLWPEARTPRQTSAELARDGKLDTAGADALAMLTQYVERVRYAPGGAAGVGRNQLRPAVDEVRSRLGATAGRQRRIRALLLPRSVGTMVGRVALRTRTRAVAARQAVLRSMGPRRA